MELTVCHSILGRIRLRVPELCRRPLLAETALSWLRKQEGIKSARINYDCASLIILYDPLHAKALQDFVDNLADLGLEDMEAFLGLPYPPLQPSMVDGEADVSWPQKRRPASHVGVLALPTLSLGLALSSNPLVVAVNVPLILFNSVPIFRRAGLSLPSGVVSPWVTAMISNGSAIVASLNGMRPLLRCNRRDSTFPLPSVSRSPASRRAQFYSATTE